MPYPALTITVEPQKNQGTVTLRVSDGIDNVITTVAGTMPIGIAVKHAVTDLGHYKTRRMVAEYFRE